MRGPKSVEVGLDLKVFSMKGTWEPSDVERAAAWELYVELVTRVAIVPLHDGLLREALNSYYSLFATSREILRRYGPEVAEPKPDSEYNFAFLTIALLNFGLRPVLSHWHPRLASWESLRPADVSAVDHEKAWPHEQEVRSVIEQGRVVLGEYATLLGRVCGVPDLRRAVPEY